MKKILHFVSKMDRAGQETFIMNVYRVLNTNDLQFVFLCSSNEPGDYDKEIIQRGGKIFYLPQIKTRYSGIKKYLHEIDVISDWLNVNRNEFDAVHLHTYHSIDVLVHLEACRRAGVRHIFIHSHNTSGPHPILHKLGRKLFVFYRFIKLACSEDAGKWMYGCSNFSVVYNGIEVNKFRFNKDVRNEYRKQLGIDEDCVVIGHVGRFSPQKNHKFLIDAFAEYKARNKNTLLLLVGKGELEHSIKNQVEAKGLQDSVIFMGVRDDVDKLLNVFDIFAFPSLYEGLSVVMIEAQINGLPVLCNKNIAKETVVSDNVHMLDIDNAMMWAKAMELTNTNRTNKIDYSTMDVACTSKKMVQIYSKEMNNYAT